MKRRLTALLTALALSLGVALPAAAPALAAPLAPVLQLEYWDGPVTEYPAVSFGLATENTEGLTVALQTLEGSTWTTVWSSGSLSEYEYFYPDYRFTSQRSLSFRAVAMSGTQIKGTSNIVSLTHRARPTIEPTDWGRVSYLPDTTVNFSVTNAANTTVVVERRSGTGWVKHWTSPVLSSATAAVKAPIRFSAAGTGTYRAHVYLDGKLVGTSYETTVTYQKPKVSLYANTADYNPTKSFTMSSWEAPGFSYQLQRWDGKTWRAVYTSGTANTTAEVKASYRIPSESIVKFRAALLRGGKVQAVSPTVSARYARQASDVSPEFWNENRPFAAKEGRIASSEVATQVWKVNTRLSNRYGSLQELRNGKWVTVQNLTWKKSSSWSGQRATIKSTKTTATVKKTYRLVVNATAYEKGWVSMSSTISHENPRHYTGYKKTAYDYMKKYCPNQVITLKAPGYSLAHDPSYRIEIAKSMPRGKSMQFVSLHECAHIISFKLYQQPGALDKRMNQIYKARNGSEQLADCMAKAMGGDIRYGGYTKNCSGYRGTAAKMVLQGKKP